VDGYVGRWGALWIVGKIVMGSSVRGEEEGIRTGSGAVAGWKKAGHCGCCVVSERAWIVECV
jgi:hypothetical protein